MIKFSLRKSTLNCLKIIKVPLHIYIYTRHGACWVTTWRVRVSCDTNDGNPGSCQCRSYARKGSCSDGCYLIDFFVKSEKERDKERKCMCKGKSAMMKNRCCARRRRG